MIFSLHSGVEADFYRSGKAGSFRGFDDMSPFLGRSVQDYYLPKKSTGIAKGGTLRFDMAPKSPIARMTKVAISRAGGTVDRPLWGAKLKDQLRAHFRDMRTLECEAFGEYSSSTATSMDVDPDTKDKWGLPVARLQIGILESNVRAVKFLADRAADIFRAMGADEVRLDIIGGTSWVLQHGTCRFGKDPKASVLDVNCRAHDVPNLFVVDGSFMPTSGGVPTTLTIQANALRVAAFIRDALAKKEI
jgi:choline dehydrogenase-like flavoprotein